MKRSIVRDSAVETTHNMMSALRDALLANHSQADCWWRGRLCPVSCLRGVVPAAL